MFLDITFGALNLLIVLPLLISYSFGITLDISSNILVLSVHQANIVRYNEELLRKAKHSKYAHPEPGSSQLLDNLHSGSNNDKTEHVQQAFPLSSAARDSEMPMPPLSLAPLRQQNIRWSSAYYGLPLVNFWLFQFGTLFHLVLMN